MRFSILLSNVTSPVLLFFMIGVLVLHLPLVKRYSKSLSKLFLSFAGGFMLLFLVELVFLYFPESKSALYESILLLVEVLMLISSCALLVYAHVQLKSEFLHLEEKFLKVFNTSPHGMMIVKVSDAMINEVNNAFVRVSGYSIEEVTGKSTLELGMWHDPEQRKEVISTLMNYESFGPVEFKFIPKSGVLTKYLFTAQFIFIKGEKYLVAHIEEKHEKSASNNAVRNLLKQRLNEIMSKEVLYKVSGLTLSDLAEKLETNKTYLSQAINSEYGNFNEYLNRFRVIEACRLIQHGLDPKFSIDYLYSEVGFSSRTTFYSAFKRFTGVSPSRFRQIQDNESKINSMTK